MIFNGQRLDFYNCYFFSGFSITVMDTNERILNRLDAPTKAPHWPVTVEG